MLWLTVFAAVIATARFLFIIVGLWWTIQFLCDRFHQTCCSGERRRKVFLFSNIIYLLGLLPHSLLLFPTLSKESSPIYVKSECMFAIGTRGSTICWIQRMCIVIALEAHILLCLNHAFQPLLTKLQKIEVWNFQKKFSVIFAASVCTIVLLWQGFYLMPNENNLRWKYLDVQKTHSHFRNECHYDIIMQPSLSAVTPKQEIQVQLLLCEEHMTVSQAENYLFFSFICGLPALVFILAMRRLHTDADPIDEEDRILLWTPQRKYQCHCLKEDPMQDTASNMMSLVISLWILLLRPLVVAFSVSFIGNFVDYGSHILLTLCVIVPITFTHPRNSEMIRSELLLKSDLKFSNK